MPTKHKTPIQFDIPHGTGRRLAGAFFVIALLGYITGWGGVLTLAGLVLITEYV